MSAVGDHFKQEAEETGEGTWHCSVLDLLMGYGYGQPLESSKKPMRFNVRCLKLVIRTLLSLHSGTVTTTGLEYSSCSRVPGLVPDAKPTLVKKPVSPWYLLPHAQQCVQVFKSRCPISGKPLKMKDLISVPSLREGVHLD